MIEALHISDVISHDDPMGSPVVALRHCSEPLLTCCVPYLKLRLVDASVKGGEREGRKGGERGGGVEGG